METNESNKTEMGEFEMSCMQLIVSYEEDFRWVLVFEIF